MAIDGEQKSKVNEWLKNKIKNNSCSSCNFNEWELGEYISAPSISDKGANILGRSVDKYVQLVCKNCAYVRLFSTKIIGIGNPMSAEVDK